MEINSDIPVTPANIFHANHDALFEFKFNTTNNLSILPIKLLLQIFSYLSPDSLVSLIESCKDLRFIVEHSLANLWPNGNTNNTSKKVCLRGTICYVLCST